MANRDSTDAADDPERALALRYAPEDGRAGLAALLALDDALARLVRTTREPAIGQIRLAWWRERLAALDASAAPAEPVLAGLADIVLPAGVRGAELVPIVEGWEVLIEETLDTGALERFAAGRGETLFALGARLCGAGRVAGAGAGWALADLSRHLSDAQTAECAHALAVAALSPALSRRWPVRARGLGALAHLARMDLALEREVEAPIGAPRRVARLLWHRLTGR